MTEKHSEISLQQRIGGRSDGDTDAISEENGATSASSNRKVSDVDPFVATQNQKPRWFSIEHHIYFVVGYYLCLLVLVFLGVFDVLSENLRLMRWLGVSLSKPLTNDPVAKLVVLIGGGFIGSILYHIRTLFRFYTKNQYNSRWFGKGKNRRVASSFLTCSEE